MKDISFKEFVEKYIKTTNPNIKNFWIEKLDQGMIPRYYKGRKSNYIEWVNNRK